MYIIEYLNKFLLGLILYNVFTERKITKDFTINTIISLIASVLVMVVSNRLESNTGVIIFVVVSAKTLIMILKYKTDGIETFSQLTMIFMSLLGFQVILQMINICLRFITENELVINLFSAVFVATVVISSIKLLKKYRAILNKKIIRNTVLNVILVNVFLFFNIIVVSLQGYFKETEILPQIIILCILIIAMNIIYLINTDIKLKSAEEIEKFDNMKMLLEESVHEMKSKEHEYKNHLNVLYCIMQVADECDLKEKAREYIGNVYEKEKATGDIYTIENTILKAILFNTMYKSKTYGVTFTYNVEGNISNTSLDDPEFTVLLSNLLNNAVEESKNSDDKFVDIDIYEEDGKCMIYIKNSIKEVDKELANDILKGIKKSTKGEGRGYGIKNVLNILKKCKGDMNIEIVENFIEFVIEIPMKANSRSKD